MEPRLTGRDTETATLATVVKQAEGGTGQLVLISGEPGIGKTTLAEHAIVKAREHGFTVLAGQADPLQGGLAYAPVVAALRGKLDQQLLDGLHDLGRLLADPRLPPPDPGGDPALNRTRMFEAVLQLLRRMAAKAPVLVFVDDLHWADHGTIELIHYLGRGTAADRLVVIGACRAPQRGSRLADLATLVRRHDHGTELALGPLSEANVKTLMHDLLGEQPEPELLRELADRTKGVPLFVTALARHTGHGPLPTIVRDLVLGRLQTLTAPERDLVDLIVVANTCATVDVLKSAAGTGHIENDLHNLVRQGHIEEHLNNHELIYRVVHPLYAEVAYAEMTEVERRRLHATLARTVDLFAPDNVMVTAPHYRDAGEYVDPQRAIDVLTQAGDRALHVFAAAEAADYLVRALSRARTDRPAAVPGLLDALGLAYQGAGMLAAATEIWSERLDIAETQTDLDRQTSLRLHLAIVESERGNPERADAHITELLGREGDHDIQSVAQRMAIAARHWDLPRARALFNQIITSYRDSPRVSARSIACYAEGSLAALDLRFDEAYQLVRQAQQLADQSAEGTMFLKFQPRRILAGLHILLGDVPSAIACAVTGSTISANFVLPSATHSMHMVHTTARYFAGDLLGALPDTEDHIAGSTQAGLHRITARMLTHRAFLLAELGRIDEARASLDQARPWMRLLQDGRDHGWEIAETMIAVHSGHPERAPKLDTFEFTFRDPIVNCMRVLVAGQAAIAAEDHAGARHVLEFLRGAGRTAPLLDVLADRQEGNLTGASDLLRESARRLKSMGAPLLAAQVDLEAAELDPDPEVIARCLDIFEQTGVTPWLDRARCLARKHNVAVAITKTAGELTKRESEVVRLVGQGLSNADIAARLFLSERTVESHLRNSYRKLAITSRLRLAQWAAGNEKEQV
jgi:DNA-binding CsgD family transcriptional regulator/tetratricopeptide (TPR) repeat protein